MTSECATHCHRELFHEQWNILLDSEFLEAYEHGIVILCCDGITRRFYPRIFTYSADYPEKYVNLSVSYCRCDSDFNRVLIATVRNLGGCPCPRCLIPKDRIQNMGKPQDRTQRETLARSNDTRRTMVSTARSLIYEKNYAVGSAPVEQILKSQSWVPTSVRLELPSLTTPNHSIECVYRSPQSFGLQHFLRTCSRSLA
jgi:Plavaka transposase